MTTIQKIWTSEVDTADYLNSFLDSYGITREEYNQNPNKYEADLYNYASEDASFAFEDLIYDINCHQAKETKYYVVKADLGLWDGIHEGGKIIFGMEQVISLCVEDYTTIFIDGRRTRISAAHHDGNNQFYIKELTKEGENFYRKHKDELSDRQMVEKLFNDRHKSRHVTIWHELFGI